jgi:hypothetical protein
MGAGFTEVIAAVIAAAHAFNAKCDLCCGGKIRDADQFAVDVKLAAAGSALSLTWSGRANGFKFVAQCAFSFRQIYTGCTVYCFTFSFLGSYIGRKDAFTG